MNAFRRALAKADAVLDTRMGENVQITPMVKGDFTGLPDPDRPAFDVVALVAHVDQSTLPVQKLETRYVTEQIAVEVRRSALAGARVRTGDEIVLLDQPGSPRVVINHVERLDPERLAFICGPVAD